MLTDPVTSLELELPAWVDAMVASWPQPLDTARDRMRLAIAMSRVNVERGGGPFAALVFAGSDWLGAGVNRVIDTGFTIAHAEVLALMTAQRRRRERLAAVDRPLSLVTTTDPCCQCYGALIWAGVDELVCGATTVDAEAIGFDEGPKPADWIAALEQRGIIVQREVERSEAAAVLSTYLHSGGTIYGGRPH